MSSPDPNITAPGERRNLAKSAARALDVLEYFVTLKRSLRASEIGQAFGWHSSSTDQLLKTMVDSGYLIFDSSHKHYRPSPRMVRFGTWLAEDYYGGDRLHRLLHLVHARSGEVVTLSVRQDATMQIVDLIWPVTIRGGAAKGTRVPLVGTALGGAYLASRSDQHIKRIIAWTDRFRRGPDRLAPIMEDVNKIRARGYASGGLGENTGTWPIAIGLPPCDADVGVVLGFAGPSERIRPAEAELAALLHRCIREVLAI